MLNENLNITSLELFQQNEFIRLVDNIKRDMFNLLGNSYEESVIMIKPSGVRLVLYNIPFIYIIKSLIHCFELEILDENKLFLTEEDINKLYNFTTFEDRKKIIYRKLLKYLTSNFVCSYLIGGIDAVEKCKIIKIRLRKFISHRVIEFDCINNYLHSSEKDEVVQNFKTLFKS